MPSSEHPRGEGAPEQEPRPYTQAARFHDERSAGRAYSRAQDTIYHADCNLSTFRLQIDTIWHVAVVGEQPERELDRRLRTILASGEPATLPPEIMAWLHHRREQHASTSQPWVEGHYWPGKRLRVDRRRDT